MDGWRDEWVGGCMDDGWEVDEWAGGWWMVEAWLDDGWRLDG